MHITNQLKLESEPQASEAFSLECYFKGCNQQALVIHRRHWFCVVHALASARIRQLIGSLRGGE
jgi:hypothetical protein